MNKPADVLIAGAAFGGGFYSHSLLIGGENFGIILAPKSSGQLGPAVWAKSMKRLPGALSYVDGLANTIAMAEAGSKIAIQAREARINGFDDWCIPARDQLEPAYRVLKPGKAKNYCYFRSGENPTTGTYAYTGDLPAQTEVEGFRDGGPEAFDADWHWTSTQCEPTADYAWFQYFGSGYQGYYRKSSERLVRLVRRVFIG